jgi:hypothetical protein
VEVGLLERGAISPLLTREGPAPDDARHRPVAALDQNALAEHLLRVERAEHAEREQAVLADVGDRDADLVDVAHQRERRRTVAAGDPGERGAERVRAHLGEAGGCVTPDRGGRALPPGRADGRQQVAEQRRDAHRHTFSQTA